MNKIKSSSLTISDITDLERDDYQGKYISAKSGEPDLGGELILLGNKNNIRYT